MYMCACCEEAGLNEQALHQPENDEVIGGLILDCGLIACGVVCGIGVEACPSVMLNAC